MVKAVRPWDRVSSDFKGPVRGPRPYLLFVDEYSRFPFVFPCKNMTSSTVADCLSSLFCFLSFPSCIPVIEEDHSSAERLGIFSRNVELRSVFRLLITRKATASVNVWIKPCGEKLSFYCTVNACRKKGANLFCWKLCMRSVLSSASRRMKLRMNVCFVSLAKPCPVQHFLHGCSRLVLCFWGILCEIRENRCAMQSNWLRLMDITPSYVTVMDKRALCRRLTWLLTRDYMKSKPNVLLRRLSSNFEVSQALHADAADDCDSGATPRDGELEVSDDGSLAPNYDSPVPMLRRSTRQRRPLDRYEEWTV